MYILSPGEKIKRLRKDIGLKQDQLTDDQITRSLISMIENGKRNLSPDTAAIIAKKLTEHYKKSGKNITAEYLLETKEEQVKKIIDNQLISIEVLICNPGSLNCNQIYGIFIKMLGLASKWKVKEHYSKTLLKRGDFNYNITKYSEALMDYFSSLDYFLEAQDFETTALIYNKIGNCFMMKGLTDEGLLYYNKACSTAKEKKSPNLKHIKMLSIYNIILSHRKTKKFDLFFKQVAIFKKLNNFDEETYNDVLLMEANTYRDLGSYEKAKDIYQKLLLSTEQMSTDALLLIYNNLSILYRNLGNNKEALVYSTKITELTEDKKLKISPDIYYDLAKCYRDLAEIDKALELLDKGFKLAVDRSNIDAIISIKLLLADIYRDHLEDIDKAEGHLLYIEELLKKQGIKNKYVDVYAKIAKFYCIADQPARCIKYLEKLHA